MNKYIINNKTYPSVTEILGQIDKGYNFYNWIAEICVKENDKNAWIKKRDKTADIGSAVHKLIEIYINIKIKKQIPDMYILLKDYDILVKQMFYEFLLFEKTYVKEFLESEKPVVNEVYCFAGTLDIVFIDKNNKVCLCDLKTKNGIYGKEPAMQIESYKLCRESMQGSYKVKFTQDDQSWEKIFNYDKIKIDYTAILCIYRDFFWTDFIPTKSKDILYLKIGFLKLLEYFYVIAARKLNNKRARERI